MTVETLCEHDRQVIKALTLEQIAVEFMLPVEMLVDAIGALCRAREYGRQKGRAEHPNVKEAFP